MFKKNLSDFFSLESKSARKYNKSRLEEKVRLEEYRSVLM
jgi:hypothetical protein